MQISFHNEEVPDGVEFDMGGILLVNGETTEISQEEEDLYEVKHGTTLKEATSRNVHCGNYVPVDPPAPTEEVIELEELFIEINDDSAEEEVN